MALFILRNNFPSIYGIMFFNVFSALFLLLQNISSSSAYLTKRCPLRSSSLSIQLVQHHISTQRTERTPWATPSSVFSKNPFCVTSAFKYLCIIDTTRPSFIVRDSTSINLLWSTVSTNSITVQKKWMLPHSPPEQQYYDQSNLKENSIYYKSRTYKGETVCKLYKSRVIVRLIKR